MYCNPVQSGRFFGVVELQRSGYGVEYCFGGARQVPSFQPGVIVDAHPGKQGHLFAAQAGDPSMTAVHGQTSLLRGDLGPTRRQELLNLGPVVHAH